MLASTAEPYHDRTQMLAGLHKPTEQADFRFFLVNRFCRELSGATVELLQPTYLNFEASEDLASQAQFVWISRRVLPLVQ